MKWIVIWGKNLLRDILLVRAVIGKKLSPRGQWGRLPIGRSPINHFNVRRANRYLNGQEKRIKRMMEKDMDGGIQLGRGLAKRSVSYRVCMFIRTFPRWYRELSLREVRCIMKKLTKDLSKGNWKIEIHRVYIEKKNGKMRPLGVPSPVSRVKASMAMDLLNLIGIQPADGQHAYGPNKGVHTAICSLYDKFNDGHTFGLKVDLTSFFNTVDFLALGDAFLRTKYKGAMIHVLGTMLSSPSYTGKELDPLDRELKLLTQDNLPSSQRHGLDNIYLYRYHQKKQDWLALINSLERRIPLGCDRFRAEEHKKGMVIRFGLPQGLAVSPALCTGYLSNIVHINMPECVFYADDGILLYRPGLDEDDFETGARNLKDKGISVAREKTEVMDPENLDGLGCKINLVKGTYECDGSLIDIKSNYVDHRLYRKEKVNGDFDILLGSWSSLYPRFIGSVPLVIRTLFARLGFLLGLRPHPMTRNGYVIKHMIVRDVWSESSRAADWLVYFSKRWFFKNSHRRKR